MTNTKTTAVNLTWNKRNFSKSKEVVAIVLKNIQMLLQMSKGDKSLQPPWRFAMKTRHRWQSWNNWLEIKKSVWIRSNLKFHVLDRDFTPAPAKKSKNNQGAISGSKFLCWQILCFLLRKINNLGRVLGTRKRPHRRHCTTQGSCHSSLCRRYMEQKLECFQHIQQILWWKEFKHIISYRRVCYGKFH
jgi:hypothetical protein